MCPYDGLSIGIHMGFKEMQKRFSSNPDLSTLSCQYNYIMPPIHSKVYIWLKHGEPYKAFSGSANYMQSSFSNDCGETLNEIQSSIQIMKLRTTFEFADTNLNLIMKHVSFILSFMKQRRLALYLKEGASVRCQVLIGDNALGAILIRHIFLCLVL